MVSIEIMPQLRNHSYFPLRNNGISISFISISLLLFAWILLTINDWEMGKLHHKLKGIGAITGIIGYCFLSLSLFLSSRWKRLENWFGGLDKIYSFHRISGIFGFCFLMIHPWIFAFKWISFRLDKFLLFLLPIHGRLSVNFGSYSFWLIVILLGITSLKLLSYDKWKISHKFMSIAFIFASLHFLLSNKLFGSPIKTKALLCIPMSIGFLSIFYKQVIYTFFQKNPAYKVIKSNIINYNVIEIFLEPKNEKLSFIPGQYAFFSFHGPSITTESHPFTLCLNRDESKISILVKARGDFTDSLYNRVKPGCIAYLEGPYGCFDFTKEGKSQVWIAGGIGIVPFLIWARLLGKSKDPEKKIDFFYCVHSKKDAIFLNEFEQLSKEVARFRFFLCCSEENSRVSAKKIKEITPEVAKSCILMCGPKRRTKDLVKQFRQIGIKRKNIVFEDFEFL